MWCWGCIVSKGPGKCSARRVTVWDAAWRARAVVRPVTPTLGGIYCVSEVVGGWVGVEVR